jgi:hypothetical protein
VVAESPCPLPSAGRLQLVPAARGWRDRAEGTGKFRFDGCTVRKCLTRASAVRGGAVHNRRRASVQVGGDRSDHTPMSSGQTWFEAVETQRWLGGRDGPQMSLDLADGPLGEFRGSQQTLPIRSVGEGHCCRVCGLRHLRSMGHVGRCPPGGLSVLEEPSGAIANVIDPARRRRGYGVDMVLR